MKLNKLITIPTLTLTPIITLTTISNCSYTTTPTPPITPIIPIIPIINKDVILLNYEFTKDDTETYYIKAIFNNQINTINGLTTSGTSQEMATTTIKNNFLYIKLPSANKDTKFNIINIYTAHNTYTIDKTNLTIQEYIPFNEN